MSNEKVIALALAVGAAAYYRPNNWAQDWPEVDAYLALIELLTNSYRGVEARMMQVAPGSEERRALLAEQIAGSGAAESAAALRLSRRILREALARAPEAYAAVLVDEDVI